MKPLITTIISGLYLLSSSQVWAHWQLSKPEVTYSREPFFHTATHQEEHHPQRAILYTLPNGRTVLTTRSQVARHDRHHAKATGVYAMSISGSLKENLERIMSRYRWRVLWKAPYDYNFDGKITGSSLPSVVQKLLQPFPLQAVMYLSNRTMTIVPRMKA